MTDTPRPSYPPASLLQEGAVLAKKRVLLGVTGGIAAYKSAELARLLIKAGARVSVVMTEAATRFVGPLTFEALTGQPVGLSLWQTAEASGLGSGLESPASARQIHHTEASRHADLIVIAPATADTLARMAQGRADDLLTSILLASKRPTLVAPAMNNEMWSHPATQRNIEFLRTWPHITLVEPASGELACGVVGPGRLPEPAELVRWAERVLIPQDLAGMRVVVTAGPTREYADPVRFWSNPSTGRMGFALADAAWKRGADVQLIHGTVDLTVPAGVRGQWADSAEQMKLAVERAIADADALVMAAAVADWRPAHVSAEKQKKDPQGDGVPMSLSLERTADILAATRDRGPRIRIGFAAETTSLVEHARAKLQAKNLDVIVANAVSRGASATGFGAPSNAGWILRRDGSKEEVPLMDKAAFAHRVLDEVARLRGPLPTTAHTPG